MNRFLRAVHFFWPWLEKRLPQEQARLEERARNDEPRIAAISLSRAPNVALDEVRRLADSEAERRRGTEQKAAIYLPLVAALIPLILSVVGALWDKKAGSAPIMLNMLILGLAVAYTAWAGWWAFKALKVASSHEPGLGDFEKAWSNQNPTATLAGRLLLHTRRNQDGIDWKVSCIMMAHEFLLRAFFAFSFLLILNIAWSIVGALIQFLNPTPQPAIATPRQALAAVARIEAFTDRMQVAPAWVVLEEDCRIRSKGRDPLRMIQSPEATAQTSPPVLKPLANERIATRSIRINCGGKTVAQLQTWYLPTRHDGKVAGFVLPTRLGAPATAAIVSMRKKWPPADLEQTKDPAELPAILARQVVAIREPGARVSAIVVTDLTPAAVVQQ